MISELLLLHQLLLICYDIHNAKASKVKVCKLVKKTDLSLITGNNLKKYSYCIQNVLMSTAYFECTRVQVLVHLLMSTTSTSTSRVQEKMYLSTRACEYNYSGPIPGQILVQNLQTNMKHLLLGSLLF